MEIHVWHDDMNYTWIYLFVKLIVQWEFFYHGQIENHIKFYKKSNKRGGKKHTCFYQQMNKKYAKGGPPHHLSTQIIYITLWKRE